MKLELNHSDKGNSNQLPPIEPRILNQTLYTHYIHTLRIHHFILLRILEVECFSLFITGERLGIRKITDQVHNGIKWQRQDLNPVPVAS